MRIIFFRSKSCPECDPAFRTLKTALSKANIAVPVEVVYVENNPVLAGKYMVASVPNIVWESAIGRVVGQMMGSKPLSKVLSWVEESHRRALSPT
jgi:thioredoxin-like negative regulator of GroEL